MHLYPGSKSKTLVLYPLRELNRQRQTGSSRETARGKRKRQRERKSGERGRGKNRKGENMKGQGDVTKGRGGK